MRVSQPDRQRDRHLTLKPKGSLVLKGKKGRQQVRTAKNVHSVKTLMTIILPVRGLLAAVVVLAEVLLLLAEEPLLAEELLLAEEALPFEGTPTWLLGASWRLLNSPDDVARRRMRPRKAGMETRQ